MASDFRLKNQPFFQVPSKNVKSCFGRSVNVIKQRYEDRQYTELGGGGLDPFARNQKRCNKGRRRMRVLAKLRTASSKDAGLDGKLNWGSGPFRAESDTIQ